MLFAPSPFSFTRRQRHVTDVSKSRLEIQPNIDVSLTCDAGSSKLCMKFEGIPYECRRQI